MEGQIISTVKDYYGNKLKSSKDLKTTACSTQIKLSEKYLTFLKNIPNEIKEKCVFLANKLYYGCGLIVPDILEGRKILDLGCGSGQDCYILAQLVGNNGVVIGVDMIPQQIANKYIDTFKKEIESSCTMEFINGYLENLSECGLKMNDFDVVISNCVINLTENKEKVLKNAFNILKDGGELYFSDVYSDNEMSNVAKEDKILWGECLSGALMWQELFDISKSIGFLTPRLVEATEIKVDNSIIKTVGNVRFISATYRLFKAKVEGTDTVNVRYLGEQLIKLDMFNIFQPDEVRTVDAELFAIISQSRLKDLFEIHSSTDVLNKHTEMYFNPFQYCSKYPSKCCNSKCC